MGPTISHQALPQGSQYADQHGWRPQPSANPYRCGRTQHEPATPTPPSSRPRCLDRGAPPSRQHTDPPNKPTRLTHPISSAATATITLDRQHQPPIKPRSKDGNRISPRPSRVQGSLSRTHTKSSPQVGQQASGLHPIALHPSQSQHPSLICSQACDNTYTYTVTMIHLPFHTLQSHLNHTNLHTQQRIQCKPVSTGITHRSSKHKSVHE